MVVELFIGNVGTPWDLGRELLAPMVGIAIVSLERRMRC